MNSPRTEIQKSSKKIQSSESMNLTKQYLHKYMCNDKNIYCYIIYPVIRRCVLHVPEAQWATALVGVVPFYPWLTTLEMPSVVERKTNCSVEKGRVLTSEDSHVSLVTLVLLILNAMRIHDVTSQYSSLLFLQ